MLLFRMLPLFGALVICAIFVDSALAARLTLPTDVGEKLLYDESYALIIAESNYRHWNPLTNVPREIDDLRAALLEQGFDVKNVQVESDVESSARLFNLVSKFIGDHHTHSRARLLIYYAGHGATTELDEGYLVPVDAPSETDPGFYSAAVAMRSIASAISLSKARHTVAIFDSCFSGAIFESRGNPVMRNLQFEKISQPIIQVITSGDRDQKVPAQSEFLPAFIAGIRGEADLIKDNLVTVDELVNYLAQKVTRTTPRNGSLGRSSSGQAVFVVPKATIDTIPLVYKTRAQFALAESGTRGASEASEKVRHLFDPAYVYYYKKSTDALQVMRALDEAGIPYTARPRGLSDRLTATVIACDPKMKMEPVRAVAKALIAKGVKIQAIARFDRNPELKRNRIEIVSVLRRGKPLNMAPLTNEQIDQTASCGKTVDDWISGQDGT